MSDTMTQEQINDACEQLLDDLSETSQLQAKILRCYYRDKLTLPQIARLMRYSEHRVNLEMIAGLRNLVSLLTGGDRLQQWSLPREADPKPGESARTVKKASKKKASKSAASADADAAKQ